MRLTFTRTPLLFIGCVLQAVVGVAAEPLSDSAANRFEALLVAVQGQRGVEMGTGGGDQLNCPPSQWGAGEYTLTRPIGDRRFRVYIPSDYDPQRPAPMVIAFHGWGGDDWEFLSKAKVTEELDAHGMLLIAPVGLGSEEPRRSPASWSFSGSTTGLDGDGVNADVVGDSEAICDDTRTPNYTYASCAGVASNSCSWTQCSDDDPNFVVALVEVATANLCVASSRIYAVGGSNGGSLTWDLGRRSDSARIFRATASIVGLPHRGYLGPPVSTGGMPALLITGTGDRTVPPGEWGDKRFTTTSNGDAYYYTGASAITEVWAESHGCDTTTPPQPVDVGVNQLECRGWSGCSGGSRWPPVLDCRRDMGHVYGLNWSWPLILDFFEQHQ